MPAFVPLHAPAADAAAADATAATPLVLLIATDGAAAISQPSMLFRIAG